MDYPHNGPVMQIMRMDIKMLSYQYRNSYYKDKTASVRLIFTMEIPIVVKSLYIESVHRCLNKYYRQTSNIWRWVQVQVFIESL